MNPKHLIGMIHLQALPTSPHSKHSIEEIYDLALRDLKSLEEGGATHAIVENFFDFPYMIDPNLETIVAYTNLFSRLKEQAKIPLGVNIHSCNKGQEMIVASLCGADFIRAETFVEARHSASGILMPNASHIMRVKNELNSKVKILADVNVKESFPFSPQTIFEAINDAIKFGADAIILTGFETGKSPKPKDAIEIKNFAPNIPLFIGSGVNNDNVSDLIKASDGVIVGSSFKKDQNINNEIDINLVKKMKSLLK